MKDEIDPAERLRRLQRVFAERRAQLALDVAHPPVRVAASTPLAKLRVHGYSVAMLLALVPMLPKLVGFAFRRRKLLAKVVGGGLQIRNRRQRLRSARAAAATTTTAR